MAGNDVTVTLRAEDAQLASAWKRAAQGPRDMGKEMQSAGKKGKDAGREIKSGMDDAGKSIANIATTITGVGSVLQGVTKLAQIFKAELDAIIARNREAAGFQVGIAGPQRKAFDALPAGGDLSKAALAALVGARSNVPQGQAYGTIAAALREGGTDIAASKLAEVGLQVGELYPHLDPGQAGSVAGFATNLMKGDKALSPAEAVAKSRQISRVSESEFGNVSEALGDYVSRTGAYGQSAGDSAALALAFQGAMGGDAGEAATSAEKLLALLFREGKGVNDLAGDSKLTAKALAAFKKTPGAETAVRELAGGGNTAEKFAEYRRQFGGSGAAALAAERRDVSESESLQPVAELERERLKSEERFKSNTRQGRLAEARAYLVDAYKQSQGKFGMNVIESQIAASSFDVLSQFQSEPTALRSAAAGIRGRVAGVAANAAMGGVTDTTPAMLAELVRQSAFLERQADALEAQNAMLEKGTPVIIEGNNTLAAKSGPNPAKALND